MRRLLLLGLTQLIGVFDAHVCMFACTRIETEWQQMVFCHNAMKSKLVFHVLYFEIVFKAFTPFD